MYTNVASSIDFRLKNDSLQLRRSDTVKIEIQSNSRLSATLTCRFWMSANRNSLSCGNSTHRHQSPWTVALYRRLAVLQFYVFLCVSSARTRVYGPELKVLRRLLETEEKIDRGEEKIT